MDKLTENIGVRVTPEMFVTVKAVAEAHGLTQGEWVRELIEEALQRERTRYQALHSIFGNETAQAKAHSV